MSSPREAPAAAPGFAALAAAAEPRLRRALVARYGVELGAELCSDALAYGWEHRDRIVAMENPVGYLFRVAQSSARRYYRWSRVPALPPEDGEPGGPPPEELPAALARLTPDQRAAVVLVHAYGWSYAEAASVLDIPVSTLRNHLHRGMKRLRRSLEP